MTSDYDNEALVELCAKVDLYDNDMSIEKVQKYTEKLRRYINVYAVIDRKILKDKLLGRNKNKIASCDKGREIWEILYREKRRL